MSPSDGPRGWRVLSHQPINPWTPQRVLRVELRVKCGELTWDSIEAFLVWDQAEMKYTRIEFY